MKPSKEISLFKFNFAEEMRLLVSAGGEEFRVLIQGGSGWFKHYQVFLQ